MNIYLNQRIIALVNDHQGIPLPAEMVTTHQPGDDLGSLWSDFRRYDRYLKWIIVDKEAVKDPLTSVDPVMIDEILQASPAFRNLLKNFIHVTAAGGLVSDESGRVLFIHRFGLWDLPKGRIEKEDYSSEDLLQAARHAAVREVREETGLHYARITSTLPCTWHLFEHKGKWILKQTFWFRMHADGTQPLKPQVEEGIFMVKWIPERKIHCVLGNTYSSLRNLIVHARF